MRQLKAARRRAADAERELSERELADLQGEKIETIVEKVKKTIPSLKCSACGETDRFRLGFMPFPGGEPARNSDTLLVADCQACECRHPFYLALPGEAYRDPDNINHVREEGPPMPF